MIVLTVALIIALTASPVLSCGTDCCDSNASCDTFEGGYTCKCNAGFTGDGRTCTDIDECLVNLDNCDVNALCENTEGSFTCTCGAGYTGDGVKCMDIDECAIAIDTCDVNAMCSNTRGAFTCACNTGYTGDGEVCHEVCVNYTVTHVWGNNHQASMQFEIHLEAAALVPWNWVLEVQFPTAVKTFRGRGAAVDWADARRDNTPAFYPDGKNSIFIKQGINYGNPRPLQAGDRLDLIDLEVEFVTPTDVCQGNDCQIIPGKVCSEFDLVEVTD